MCLMFKGLESDVDANISKLSPIPGLEHPRYSTAEIDAPCHIKSSRHALYYFQSTDARSIRTV